MCTFSGSECFDKRRLLWVSMSLIIRLLCQQLKFMHVIYGLSHCSVSDSNSNSNLNTNFVSSLFQLVYFDIDLPLFFNWMVWFGSFICFFLSLFLNMRVYLFFRCSGKNHCRVVFNEHHPYSVLWPYGTIHIKYICMERK